MVHHCTQKLWRRCVKEMASTLSPPSSSTSHLHHTLLSSCSSVCTDLSSTDACTVFFSLQTAENCPNLQTLELHVTMSSYFSEMEADTVANYSKVLTNIKVWWEGEGGRGERTSII